MESMLKEVNKLYEEKRSTVTQTYLIFRRELERFKACCHESDVPDEMVVANEKIHEEVLKEIQGWVNFQKH